MTWRNKIGLMFGVFWMGLLSGGAFVSMLCNKYPFGVSFFIGFDIFITLLVPFMAGMLYVKPIDPKHNSKVKRKK